MSKPIAERFNENTFEVDQSMFHETEIINWLKQQPENNKTFSLEEVENLIMDAYLDAQYMMAIGAITTPRENSFEYQAKEYARVKKEELMK